MKYMLNIMLKYLNMGMSLKDVIQRATWNSARSVKREDLGQLSEGAVADLTILGVFNYWFFSEKKKKICKVFKWKY